MTCARDVSCRYFHPRDSTNDCSFSMTAHLITVTDVMQLEAGAKAPEAEPQIIPGVDTCSHVWD